MVIVKFQHGECYEEILDVWLVCFPMCFWETLSLESKTLFSVKRVCSIGFMNEIRSIISKKLKKKSIERLGETLQMGG